VIGFVWFWWFCVGLRALREMRGFGVFCGVLDILVFFRCFLGNFTYFGGYFGVFRQFVRFLGVFVGFLVFCG